MRSVSKVLLQSAAHDQCFPPELVNMSNLDSVIVVGLVASQVYVYRMEVNLYPANILDADKVLRNVVMGAENGFSRTSPENWGE